MERELKERSQMDPAYEWDLSSLFADDAAWEKEYEEVKKDLALAGQFDGKLTDAKGIRKYYDYLSEAMRKIVRVYAYANLQYCEDTRNASAQKMVGKAQAAYVQFSTAFAYAEPQILALDQKKLEEIHQDPLLKDYAFLLEQLIDRKPHTLSGREEALLASFGEALSAPSEAATRLMDADMTFESALDAEGKEHEVTESNYILLQTSQDRTLRENSFRKFYDGFRKHNNTFASTYAGCVKGAVAEAKARHYASSREMSMSQNHIPVSVYDNLIETVHRHMDAMYRYVKFRKRMLGVDELHYYDLYAPLAAGSAKSYTYEEAQKLVLEAVKPLGEEYGKVVQGAFRDRWIDVYPNKGKTGGAFSEGVYGALPYILTNFTGTLDSVSTIAHEMGHSMHSWLTNHAQPFQYSEYTLFVAEVASTVNENLLIEDLLQKTEDPHERLALLNEYLEGFKGTVYRQTMFAEFEKEAHALAERGEPLDTQTLNQLYRGLIEQYFGRELAWDEEVQYEWSRIPHFYRPFYVYVYATGYSSASALSQGILQEGQPAVKRYLEFLSMGSSEYPLDELKHAGVDLTTSAPIDAALDKFARVLDDAEKTAEKLGK